jgi:hypothetical protein
MGDVRGRVIVVLLLACAGLTTALGSGCSAPPPHCAKVVSSVGAAQSAVNSASSGSTVCLANGLYPQLALTALKAAPGVRVEPQHPGKATIAGAKLTGSGLTIQRFRIQGGGVVIAPNSTGMTVSHNLIVGGRYFGVMVCPAEPPDRCNDVSILGNIFYGSFDEDAIRANVYHDSGDSDPYGLRVDGNEFVGNVEHGGHNDVFQSVWVGDHLYFRNNYIHDFGGQGFFVKDQASAIDTLVVENNLIVRQNKPCNPASLCPGYQLSPFQIFGPVRNASIRHNTVWGQEGGVVTLRGTGWTGPTAVTDNAFYKTYSDSTQFSTAGYTASNNVRCVNDGFPGGGFTTSCSPGFRNTPRGDWRAASARGVTWVPSTQWYGP